jgi:branched-chain amino acid transport system ATP-binding protein
MVADSALLEVIDIRKSFGGITAVDDVSFSIRGEEITGLIGPNGAGKTTTFDLLSGFLDPDAGQVLFDGKPIQRFAPHECSLEGLVRTFQITRELTGMTVMENMLLGGQRNPGEHVTAALANTESVRSYESRNRDRARKWLKILDLWELRDEYAGNLSGGQRKLLELGRALMTEPDLLLLDEPMAGVNPTLTNRLLEHLTQLRDEEGLTFVIIEHDMDAIMTVSDTVIAMHNGRVLTEGPPEAVKRDEALLEAYLGGGEI